MRVCGMCAGREWRETRTFCISASLGMRKVFWACLMASRVKAAPSLCGPAAASTATHASRSSVARMITPGRPRAPLYTRRPAPPHFHRRSSSAGPLAAPPTAPTAPCVAVAGDGQLECLCVVMKCFRSTFPDAAREAGVGGSIYEILISILITFKSYIRNVVCE